MPNNQLLVGPGQYAGGANPTQRGGNSGEGIIQQLHGKYYEQAVRGKLFLASNVAAQAVSVALTATYTGLCISNPLGNTKNLVLLGMQYALSVAPAAIASLHLIGGYSATANVTHTAALAAPGIQNCLLGVGPASTMKADTQATIVNPGYVLPICSGFTAAALPSMTPLWIDLAGLIVVPPGGWVAVGALTAVTGFGGFAWEEVDLVA